MLNAHSQWMMMNSCMHACMHACCLEIQYAQTVHGAFHELSFAIVIGASSQSFRVPWNTTSSIHIHLSTFALNFPLQLALDIHQILKLLLWNQSMGVRFVLYLSFHKYLSAYMDVLSFDTQMEGKMRVTIKRFNFPVLCTCS